jgi:hypothetical protein
MESDPKSKGTIQSSLVSDLIFGHKTGVFTIKDNDLSIKIYLKNGILVHCDGLDKDTVFINEIAARKNLDPDQVKELILLKDREPHSLGQALMGLGLISAPAWEKYLVFRSKQHLVAALQMYNPEIAFKETEPAIHSINSVNREIIEVLLESIRSIRNYSFFERFLTDPKSRFKKSHFIEDLESKMPLNADERKILGLIDGYRTLEDIAVITDFSSQELNPIVFAFNLFGLIIPVEETTENKKPIDYTEVINLYLDLLKVLEDHFKKEIGQEFRKIIVKSQKGLTGRAAELFQDIDLVNEDYRDVVKKIYDHFSKFLELGESPLILSSSFNKLIYLLIIKMKEILGTAIAEKVLKEMLNMVGYVEKHRPDSKIMEYLRENLKDYLVQIKK